LPTNHTDYIPTIPIISTVPILSTLPTVTTVIPTKKANCRSCRALSLYL